MKTKLFRRLVGCCAVLLGWVYTPPLSADSGLDQLLPETTRFYLKVDSVPKLREKIETAAFDRLWDDDAMRSILNELKWNGVASFFKSTYGVDHLELLDAVKSQMVFAAIETTNGQLSLAFLIRLHEANDSDGKRLVARAVQAVEQRGARKIALSLKLPATAYEMPEAGEQLVFLIHQGFLLICGDVEIAKLIAERWDDVQSGISLRDREEFARTMKQTDNGTNSDIVLFVDPAHLVAAIERSKDAGKKRSVTDRVPSALRHGFPGIRGVSARFDLGATLFDIVGRIAIDVPQPRMQALKMFDFLDGDLAIPEFVPANVSSCSVAHWNVLSIIQNLAPIYDDIAGTPLAFEKTLSDAKTELGVDLENDLFPILGPRLIVFSHPIVAKRTERSIMAIDIQSPKVNGDRVSQMIERMFAEDTEAKRIKLPNQRHELWKLQLTVGNEGAAFSNAGVMVADGKLWLATHASLIDDMIRRQLTGKLIESADYLDYKESWKTRDLPTGFMRTFLRADREIEGTYDVLRRRGMDGLSDADGIYARILVKLFESSEEEITADFSKLPEFSAIRKYFGILGITAGNTPTGWQATISHQLGTP